MTAWLLVYFVLQAATLQGVNLIAAFKDQEACFGAMQHVAANAGNVNPRYLRCVEASIGEGA